MEKNFDLDRDLELQEEEFKALEKSHSDKEGEKEKAARDLRDAYENIIDILKEYVDLEEGTYNIVALWIIGTYFHNNFPSYPFLFFNAMKGSGKTRTMNLVTFLSKGGEMLLSPTEAVLFRSTGTLGIDEFEGVTRKGNENLRELLNACYKKGNKVKRIRQKKTNEGVEMVLDAFDVYRPITLANIWGMENVLGDRCITLILEKSDRKEVTNLVEIWDEDEKVKSTKELLERCSKCSLCSLCSDNKVYREWNLFVKNNYTNSTNNTNNTNYTNYTEAFKTIKSMDLNGRELELSLPLCLIANQISQNHLHLTTLTLKSIFESKKEEELTENYDISLYDFVSQIPNESDRYFLTDLVKQFKEFLGSDEDWINSKWFGRGLKRLNLVIDKARRGRGTSVVLDVNKAKEKLKIFQ